MDDLSEKPQDGLTGEVSFGPDDPQVQARSAYDVSPIIDQNLYKTARAALERNKDRPFPSAHEFVQHQLNKDEPQLPQYDREAEQAWQEGGKEAAHLAAYGIPVVGEGLAAYDMANALRDIASPEFRKAVSNKDYLTAGGDIAGLGLAALGAPGKLAKAAAAAGAVMMPQDAQASFFSRMAKMSPSVEHALEQAERALQFRKADKTDTWYHYGWAPDPAGNIVSELSDENARLIPQGLRKFRNFGEDVKLGEILSHPDLFDLYPSSYNKTVQSLHPGTEARGWYDPGRDLLASRQNLSDEDLLKNILHEHQHRIQHIEGMSPGTNPEVMIGPEEAARSFIEQRDAIQGAISLQKLMRGTNMDPIDALMLAKEKGIPIASGALAHVRKPFDNLLSEMDDLTGTIHNIRETTPSRFDQYFNSLGEWTARLPGERLKMTEGQRRASYPFPENFPVIVRPPSTIRHPNERSAIWEAERERAIDIARQLKKQEEDEAFARRVLGPRRNAYDKGGAVAKLLGKLMPPGSGYAPRKGFQTLVDLPGIGKAESRPIPGIEEIARRFAGLEHDADVTALNPEFARRVAGEYDVMRHDPTDAAVKRAYEALADETMQQYRAAKDLGLDIRFLKPGEADPYAASPALGYEDLVNRGRMFVFPTESGFGSSGEALASNVLLKGAGRIGNKDDAVINDAFRVVHDLFGHHGPGNPSFRAPGEERAYQLHSRMFSPEARPALTSETRGQNSWVNFGPEAERNRTASGADTIYADQKTGIMPAWTMARPPEEGVDVDQYIRSLRGYAPGGAIKRALEMAGKIVPADRTKLNFTDVTKRVPELTEAAKAIGQDITPEEYQKLVNAYKPVKPWDFVPAPATRKEMLDALWENKRERLGAGKNISAGADVGLRLDIPAYTSKGVWIPTIHGAGASGSPIAHEPVARVRDARFNVPERKALDVASGIMDKSPFAKILGKWSPTSEEEAVAAANEYLRHPDWRQVGMDPERHSYFYDRASQEPVLTSEDVLQVGPLVLAKNPQYGSRKDFKYASGGVVPRADDEDFFRRMALWTYSVAPLFSGRQALAERRRGYDKGGAIAKAIQQAAKVLQKNEPLFDFSRLAEVPKTAQFDLPRYIPPRGVSDRAQDLIKDKDVFGKMMDIVGKGKEVGGPEWYNTDPLRERFIQQLGSSAGPEAYRKYMDIVAATSPRSDVPTNIRNASYYYGKLMRGEPLPKVGDVNPKPYGHLAQRAHQKNVLGIAGTGWDPLVNPKPSSFVEDLVGNQLPVSVDTHAFRLPAILSRDPRFLEKAYKPSKEATPINYQDLFKRGERSMEDLVSDPVAWSAFPRDNEYGALEGLYKRLGLESGLTPAQAQASAWVGGHDITGLKSDETKPFLEFFQDKIYDTARKTNMDPQDVLNSFIQGKTSLRKDGGSVIDHALDVVSNIPHSGKRDAA